MSNPLFSLFVQSSNSMDTIPKLHIVLFPWLAMGHLIPFFHLSKSLAQKGLQISFISTPRNIQRLPKIPPNLSHLINLITFPLPHIQNLPPNAEASTDLPIKKSQYLKKAFDGLQSQLTTFLQSSNPDWIIFDYASHWVPGIGAQLGIPCIYFSVFTAAFQAFVGPPWALLSKDDGRVNPEDFTVVPEWIPFPSSVVFRYHELLHYYEGAEEIVSGFSDTERFGYSIRDCDFVALRSCFEFESDWLTLLSELYQKPVIPIGVLPPGEEVGDDIDEKWVGIKEWLDKQREGSVVYVALGTEAVLSQEQLNALALGLERSELPFFWVLRKPPLDSVIPQLPDGFEDRISGSGLVYMSWAPQVKILSHPSVGGFLTHCGYNSIIEGLGLGRVLILLPILNDQGLNARLLEKKQLGLEIPRNERDGSFSSESVAKSVRVVMVEKEGEELRNNAKEMKAVFGDKGKNDSYIDGFVKYLNEYPTPASRV